MVRHTPPSQDASTHQIWNSYLKQYWRYAPDTKRDGQTMLLLYASQSSFGGIKKYIIFNHYPNFIKYSFMENSISLKRVNPLYTNGFSLLVCYNKLRIVHYTYIVVSGYIFRKPMYFFCLKIFFTLTNSVDPDEMQHYGLIVTIFINILD